MSSLDETPWFALASGSACRGWAVLACLGGGPGVAAHSPVGQACPLPSHQLIAHPGRRPCCSACPLAAIDWLLASLGQTHFPHGESRDAASSERAEKGGVVEVSAPFWTHRGSLQLSCLLLRAPLRPCTQEGRRARVGPQQASA